MFVSRLDRPWLGTPFLIQGLLVKTQEDIDNFRRWCRYVYIDTERGVDAPYSIDASRWENLLQTGLMSAAAQASYAGDYQVDFAHEIGVARDLLTTADALLRAMLNDVRLHKRLNAGQAKFAVADMAQSIMRNPDAMLFLTALKDKDQYTTQHSINVCILALAFGRELGLPMGDLVLLGLGALLHDIGKMATPEEILNKPGELTPGEWQIVKRHVTDGVRLLEHVPGFPERSIEIVQRHHERFDGSGYPEGLSGKAIGLFGLIASVTDVYDAMTSERVYRSAVTSYEALKHLFESRNATFDSELVLRFIQCLGVYPVGSLVELSSGEVGLVVSVHPAYRLRPRVRIILDPQGKRYPSSFIVDLMNQFVAPGSVPLEVVGVVNPATYDLDLGKYLQEETGLQKSGGSSSSLVIDLPE